MNLFKLLRTYSYYIGAVIVLLIIIGVALFSAQFVKATGLTETAIRLDRMGAGVTASTSNKILVVVKPTTVGTIAKLKISWPTTNAFTVGATVTSHTVTVTGLPSTFQGESVNATLTLGSSAISVSSGDVVYSVSGMSSATTLYGFYITGGITNPSTGNAGTHSVVVTTLTSGDAVIDATTVGVDVTTTNADQVTVSATVPSSFNFALSGNSLSLGTLGVGSTTTGNVTVDVDTNANNGWAAWFRSEGASAALTSASTGHSISSVGSATDDTLTTVAAGTEYYQLDVAVAAGSGSTGSRTVATEYDGNGANTGGTISTSYQEIAYSTGQANSDTITLTTIVAISGLTEAATDYTDTWEVVGAANF